MNQRALLEAIRRDPPVSIAPDGGPLRFVPASHIHTIAVMKARRPRKPNHIITNGEDA